MVLEAVFLDDLCRAIDSEGCVEYRCRNFWDRLSGSIGDTLSILELLAYCTLARFRFRWDVSVSGWTHCGCRATCHFCSLSDRLQLAAGSDASLECRWFLSPRVCEIGWIS